MDTDLLSYRENKPRISILAAIGKNRELGIKNSLIWHISDDLRRLKTLSMGHPVLMGRKTFDSIGHPLYGRTNIIITQKHMCIDGCLVFHSFEEGLAASCAIDTEEIFILGGESIYRTALPYVHRLYLTLIDMTEKNADVFFPDYHAFTKIIYQENHPEQTPPFMWRTLER